ncbi:hypothetical protein [Pseudoduganella buxea]|uniref:Uncharacterized protein n=1 Tax=Pseudoduganella buxea TaxID=1949069 RepID=A0A6I3SX16_9BURK|nr:hypothetical protein [Pseudoduganella buxea]MTV52247.1 hypothetical protein [Pseudoduganella buxea]
MTLADRWMSGFDCASGNNPPARKVRLVLDTPGSFVKRRAESALIVVPAASLVALVHDG